MCVYACVNVCVCMRECVCSAGIIFAYSKLQVSYLHTVKAGIIFAYSKYAQVCLILSCNMVTLLLLQRPLSFWITINVFVTNNKINCSEKKDFLLIKITGVVYKETLAHGPILQ